MDNIIIINTKENSLLFKDKKEVFYTDVLIGKNGATRNKIEGDGKTPIGIFDIGIAFGIHDRSGTNINNSIKYIKINKNLYWIDDINSKYYNILVDIAKVQPDWKSAEHLIDYLVQYEYAIEIKVNPKNIPGKGSAIFIHCSNGKKTMGCIALQTSKMEKLLTVINKNTKVVIK